MSSRDPFGIDPEDLGVRARRGLLSKAEQRELERATDASASLRIAYEVGRDLDAVSAVRGGDDALIANAAAAALARAGGELERGADKPRRARGYKRRVGAVAIGFAVLAASGAAAALWSGVAVWPLSPPYNRPVSNDGLSPRVAVRSRTPHPHMPPPAPIALPVPASVPALIAAEPESVTGKAAAGSRAHHKSAAELFHAANAARRDADFARAVQLYAELRSAYPDSAEGELAQVSLGQLLLARGDAVSAEREFRRYLARGRGQLTEEALLGRAQSLERSGKVREERDSLQRLLTEFPHSVYTARARARLNALAGEAASAAH